MKYKSNSASIVIAGKWNKYLLSPPWVAKNIFNEENINVQISTALDAPPRFVKNNIMLVVTSDHIIITAIKPEDDGNLKEAERIAIQLITILEHTPITALGINFTFVLNEDENVDINSYFILGDNESIVDNGLILESGIIQRKFKYDSHFLNLTITKGNQVEIQLNHHFDFSTSKLIQDYLDQTKFIEKRKDSIEFMNNIYDKNIDHE